MHAIWEYVIHCYTNVNHVPKVNVFLIPCTDIKRMDQTSMVMILGLAKDVQPSLNGKYCHLKFLLSHRVMFQKHGVKNLTQWR